VFPRLVPLDAVDRGAVDAKLLSDLGDRLATSLQLALNLQHLLLRQRRPRLAARHTSLRLRLRSLYGGCTYSLGCWCDCRLGHVQFDVLAGVDGHEGVLQGSGDLLELFVRKNVHDRW